MEPEISPDALAGRFSADDHYFHQEYLTDAQGDDDAAELLGLLNTEPGARLLDAGCGDGRLAVRLAALGYQVVGVDADPDQLRRASARTLPDRARVEWRCADLASFEDHEGFDGVFSWFNSLGYGSDEHFEAVLDRLCAVLRPGGTVVIDTLDAEVIAEILHVGSDPVSVTQGGDLQTDQSRFDAATQRLEVDRTVTRDGATTHRHLSVRLLSVDQWRVALEARGVELMTATARAGAPRSQSEGELVLMGRRR